MVSSTATLFAPVPSFQLRVAAFARLAVVVLVHAVLLAVIAQNMDVQPPKAPLTIQVALIAPPKPLPVAPPKVEPPPEPPKAVDPPPPPPPVVRKVEKPKPRVKPKPRPQPEQAITPPTPAPAAEPEPVVEPTPPPVAAAPAPAAAPPAVVEPRYDAAYLNNPKPRYPRVSRRLGEQGKVLLRVLVSADGKAKEVRLHRSSGYKRLDEAARDAVTQWRFVPARRGDEAVEGWFVVPIEFKLKDA